MSETIQKAEKIQQMANSSPCICFNIRKAARKITQIYDEILKPTGLTATQLSILNSLITLGDLSVLQLAQAMATDRTTITRNLKPLERDGFISIEKGIDKRQKNIHVTSKGKNSCQKAMDLFTAFKKNLDQTVGQERVGQLCQELNDVVDKIAIM